MSPAVATDSTGERVLRALQQHGLKQEAAGWRCNSPLRPGADSHSFSIKIDPDGEHGAWKDHVSEASGSLYELAKILGVPVNERTEVASTKRAYAGLDDYARAHGIDTDTLVAAGWSEVTREGRPALAFNTQTGKRWRFIDGEKPHYKSEPGYRPCWYGIGKALKEARRMEAPIILCNGEISVVTAHAYGVPALCVTAGEKGTIPDHLLSHLVREWREGDILITLDCDAKGRKSAHDLAKQLNDAGFNARPVDLKLTDGGDLADFCMLAGRDAMTKIMSLPTLKADAQPPAQQTLSLATFKPERPILHESELRQLPPVQWYIQGELPTNGLGVIFGPSGAGKSFLAIDYAQRIARIHPVMYVAAEGESGMLQRSAAWRQHHRADFGKLFFHLGAVWTWEDADVLYFINRIQQMQPKVVIIDTLSHCIEGSDSDDKEVRRFVRACQAIQHSINGLVLVIHHSGWSTTQRERGSSVLRGACDTMIRVSPEDDVIRIESSKTKDARPFPARFMKLLPVTTVDGDSMVLVEAPLVVQGPTDKPSPHQMKVLEFLALDDNADGASKSDIAEATEINKSSLPRITDRLARLGFIVREKTDRQNMYRITESGRDIFERYSNEKGDQTLFTLTTSEGDRGVIGVIGGDRPTEKGRSLPTSTGQTGVSDRGDRPMYPDQGSGDRSLSTKKSANLTDHPDHFRSAQGIQGDHPPDHPPITPITPNSNEAFTDSNQEGGGGEGQRSLSLFAKYIRSDNYYTQGG